MSAQAKSESASGGINTFPDDQLVLVGNDGGILAATGALSSRGASFNLIWTHSY